MKAIVLQLDQFAPDTSPGGNVRPSEIILKPLLEIVAWMNCVQLATNPWIEPLYTYGQRGQVRYQREPSLQDWARSILGQGKPSIKFGREDGVELFNGIKEVIRQGGGDCDDLTAWRVAELRVRGSLPYYPKGEPAELVILKFPPTGDRDLLYHIQVRRAPTPKHPNPRDPFLMEDPSAILGMPSGDTPATSAPPLIQPVDPSLMQSMMLSGTSDAINAIATMRLGRAA